MSEYDDWLREEVFDARELLREVLRYLYDEQLNKKDILVQKVEEFLEK